MVGIREKGKKKGSYGEMIMVRKEVMKEGKKGKVLIVLVKP